MTTIQKIGQRLKELRQSVRLSQSRIAVIVKSSQPAIARYEVGEAHIPADVLLNYANYFDVSLDYIYCRTDNPKGTQYENKPKVEKIYPEMEKFIEMCFDPDSPMNEKLKETLKKMLKEGAE